jgi:TrmH family RNA methyltransferase
MASAITSKDHPLARAIRLVAAGSRRAPAELVLAEGVRVLEEATRSGRTLEAVVVTEGFGRLPREQALLEAWAARRARVHTASGRLLRALSEVTTPQGGIALVRVPAPDLAALGPAPLRLVVVACGVQDPGNLGSLVRSARAAGAELVCVTRDGASARSPKAIRGSAGAFFHLPVVESVDPEVLVEFCRRRSLGMVRCDVRGAMPLWEADLRAPTALLVGGEARGFDGAAWLQVPSLVIPMAPGAESLNVAAAGAIVLFEARRQRAAPGGQP